MAKRRGNGCPDRQRPPRSASALLLGLALLGIGLRTIDAGAQALPYRNGSPFIPDTILLAERTAPWSYTIAPSASPVALSTRAPNAREVRVIERARALLAAHDARAIALVDGRDIVHIEYKAPATDASWYFSASVAKISKSPSPGSSGWSAGRIAGL